MIYKYFKPCFNTVFTNYVDIKFSSYDAFLESRPSGNLKAEIMENQIIPKKNWGTKTKGPKQDDHN